MFQEMDDLELEDDEGDPDCNPADRERDSTDYWTSSSSERPACRRICGRARRALSFLFFEEKIIFRRMFF